jgi:hypothetical protein
LPVRGHQPPGEQRNVVQLNQTQRAVHDAARCVQEQMAHESRGGWIGSKQAGPLLRAEDVRRDVGHLQRQQLHDALVELDLQVVVRVFPEGYRGAGLPWSEDPVFDRAQRFPESERRQRLAHTLHVLRRDQQIHIAHRTLTAPVDALRVQCRALQREARDAARAQLLVNETGQPLDAQLPARDVLAL